MPAHGGIECDFALHFPQLTHTHAIQVGPMSDRSWSLGKL